MPDHAQRGTHLLTIAETSRRLACSVRHVYHLIALEHLVPIKLSGRATRIDEAELERFIESRRAKK